MFRQINNIHLFTAYRYYLANTEANPEEQYLYKTLVVGLDLHSTPTCMSCKTNCKFHKAEMSAENNYFSLVCSGPNVPEVSIFKTVRAYNKIILINKRKIVKTKYLFEKQCNVAHTLLPLPRFGLGTNIMTSRFIKRMPYQRFFCTSYFNSKNLLTQTKYIYK